MKRVPSVISLLRGIERRQRRYHQEILLKITHMRCDVDDLAAKVDSLVTVVRHAERLLKEKEALQKQLDDEAPRDFDTATMTVKVTEANQFIAAPARDGYGYIGAFHLKCDDD